MKAKIEKWTDRLQKEGLVDFALDYLQKSNVDLPADNRRRSASRMSRREQLEEMVLGLQGSDSGKLRYRFLLDSVRQERARRVREKEKRLIKRLDLRESICAKLAAMSRATRLRESTLVEELITDEAAITRGESFTLKQERQKLKDRARSLKENEAKLKAREADLSRRDESFAKRLARLAAFEKLVNAIIECEEDDLNVRINVDPEGSVKNLFTFSFSPGSSNRVRLVADAWDEVLGLMGKDAGHS